MVGNSLVIDRIGHCCGGNLLWRIVVDVSEGWWTIYLSDRNIWEANRLFIWLELIYSHSNGTIAAVAVAFGKFTAYLIPQLNDAAPLFQRGEFKITWIQIVAMAVIILLTFINTRGIKSGKAVQSFFTSAKIIALILLILGGLLLIKENHFSENMAYGWDSFQNLKGAGWSQISGGVLMGALAAAMVGSVFSSVAWKMSRLFPGNCQSTA